MSGHKQQSAMAFVVGAAVGFVAGILLAPKSGKETRSDLKRGVERVRTATEQKLHQAQTELSTMITAAEAKAKQLGSKLSAEAKQSVAVAKKTRSQAAEVLKAVKKGESSDEDLDIAVKNAQSALEGLRAYFKK